MDGAYQNCPNLYGDMFVYSNNVFSANYCFSGRNTSKQLNIVVNFGTDSYSTFTGNPIANETLTLTNAGNGSIYCWNDWYNIVIFNMQTTSMYNAFRSDTTVTKAACGPNVTNMADAYRYCTGLKGSPVCRDKVTDMSYTYQNCSGLTGKPVCGPNVTNMYCAYMNCQNLTGSPVCGDKVTKMYQTYYNCYKLTGSPVCGPNVTDMRYTYNNCSGLTGNPVCGPNVTTMIYTYQNCSNLTGSPVCGVNVTDMDYTYANCTKLTGKPVCGDKVKSFSGTYDGCTKLTGPAICGPNVTKISNTYANCPNLSSNAYFYSNKITSASKCFYGRNTRKRLNLYIPSNGNTKNTCLSDMSSKSLTGTSIIWTNSFATNGCYYNTAQNIYIYPVSNVAQVYNNNEK
jgi:hypothetical protein